MNTLHRAKSRCVEVLLGIQGWVYAQLKREKKTGAGDLYDGLTLLSGNWMYHWARRRSNRRACTD